MEDKECHGPERRFYRKAGYVISVNISDWSRFWVRNPLQMGGGRWAWQLHSTSSHHLFIATHGSSDSRRSGSCDYPVYRSGSKTIKGLSDFHGTLDEIPRAFRHVKAQLPLIVSRLDKIKDRAIAGVFEPPTAASLALVIKECSQAADELSALLEKALPSVADSRWLKTKKAFVSSVLDKKINTLESTIKQYINVLEFHHVVWLIGSWESKSSPEDNKSNPFWLVHLIEIHRWSVEIPSLKTSTKRSLAKRAANPKLPFVILGV